MAIQKSKRLQPLHPGEVHKELLAEAGLTDALALALRVPANRIGGIVMGQRGITGNTSLRLARYFGTSAQMWMNLPVLVPVVAHAGLTRRHGTAKTDKSTGPRLVLLALYRPPGLDHYRIAARDSTFEPVRSRFASLKIAFQPEDRTAPHY